MPATPRIRTVTYSKETKKGPSYAYNPVTSRSIRVCRICPRPPPPIIPGILDGGNPFGSGPYVYDGGSPGSVGSITLDGGIVYVPGYDGGSPSVFGTTVYDGGSTTTVGGGVLDGGNS